MCGWATCPRQTPSWASALLPSCRPTEHSEQGLWFPSSNSWGTRLSSCLGAEIISGNGPPKAAWGSSHALGVHALVPWGPSPFHEWRVAVRAVWLSACALFECTCAMGALSLPRRVAVRAAWLFACALFESRGSPHASSFQAIVRGAYLQPQGGVRSRISCMSRDIGFVV